MKSKIDRVVTIGEEMGYFKIYADDKLIKCLSFKEGVDEVSIFNEEKNKAQAIAIAKQIEETDSLEQKETIYQSEQT